MNRKDFFFRQKVTEAELDAAFDDVEQAFKAFVQGFNYVGVALGADVTEAAVPNLTVDASGPAIIYDQTQERIGWTTTQNVNVAVDENGVSTAVAAAPNEKWVSIFAKFKRDLQDPRVDGNSDTVFHERNESFEINVAQGAEAPIGTATRPGLRGDQILLADVLLTFGQTTVLNADISTTRTEVIYDLTGSPLAIQEKGLQAVLQAMVDQINLISTTGALLGATQTFTGDNTFDGEIIRDAARDPEDDWLRSEAPGATSDAVLLGRFRVDTAPDRWCRLYYTGATLGGGFMMTFNCRYDVGATPGQEWIIDDVGELVTRVIMGEDGFKIQGFDTTPASPFANADWTDATQTASGIDVDPSDFEATMQNIGFVFTATDATLPIVNSTQFPDAHPGEPANFYKLLFRAATDSGHGDVRLFATQTGFAITVNAFWDPTAGASGEWAADVAHATDNPALFVNFSTTSAPNAAISVLIQADTSVAWTTFDNFGFNVAGMGDMQIAGNYNYASSRLNTIKELSAWKGANADPVNLWTGAGGQPGLDGEIIATAASAVWVVPLNLPAGNTLTRVEALVSAAGASAMFLAVYEVAGHDYGGTPATPTRTQLGILDSTGGAGLDVLSTGSFSNTADPDKAYIAVIGSGQASDKIYGVRMWFTDNGMNNR